MSMVSPNCLRIPRRLLRPGAGFILGQGWDRVQIPYNAIGIGISFLLGIWAFIITETNGGRIFIAAAMFFLFILRLLWPGRTGSLVWLIGWMLFGIGCLIAIRWHGVSIR